MKKIDISNWKEFKVGDLFDIHPTKHYNGENGKALPNRNLFDDCGINPVIVNSAYNNGVGGYTNKPCNEKGGIITFSDTTTSDAIFYQENDFVGYSHVQGLYPIKYKNKWNKYSMKFFEVVFHRRADSLGYNFVNKFTRDLASRIVVKLPTKRNKGNKEEIDWQYMESYMKNIIKKAGKNINNLDKLNTCKHKLEMNLWKGFKIGDLFFISRPKARNFQMYDRGDLPYIASGSFNNGICGYFAPKNKKDFDMGNCITISPVDGYAFYQKYNFLGRGGGGSSIIILRRKDLNEYVGKFICTIIRRTCEDWTYSNMGNKDKLKNIVIKLPVTLQGSPNWQYMENYMKSVFKKTEKKVELFTSIVK